MKKKLVSVIAIIVVLVAAIGFNYKSANASKQGVYTLGIPQEQEVYYESSYASYLESNGYQGTMASDEVVIDLTQMTSEEGTSVTSDSEGVTTPEQGKVTWTFEVKTSGFYNLEVGYIPLEGKNSTIQRKMYLDDQVLFDGLEQVSFEREWINEGDEIEIRNDNEIRPNTIEQFSEQQVFVQDAQRRMSEPYKFYLEAGTHTLTFESVREPMKVTNLTFKAAEEVLSYDETIQALQSNYPEYKGELLLGQAERNEGITSNILKTSRSILINSNYSSARLEPAHPYNIVFNTIGGDSWKTPGDAVTWEIEVPETGLYQLSLTAKQGSNRGAVSYRRLLVNGQVPFEEANALGFPYTSDFTNYVIGNEEGAYLIPLEAGTNTITLETVLGAFDKAVTEVEDSLIILNEMYRKIIQLTGTVPDTFIDYDIEKKLPEVKTIFTEESERLYMILNEVIEITGEKGEDSVILEKLAYQLEQLAEDPELVVKELAQLKNNISSLGLWNMEVSSMPLEIDALTLSAKDATLNQTVPGFVESTTYETIRFLSTFVVDNTTMSGESGEDQKSIKVWLGTGRDQAQVLMNLIEERFTPETNIHVELELIPESVIIPATVAGNGPDVVLGLREQQVMNFAVRNAVVDLSELESFDSIYDNYMPSAFEAVSYLDGIYGLPEQQTFMMLFYRQDVLAELGIEVPKTWDEVRDIIPILQMNNYDFYVPSGTVVDPYSTMYSSLVFQDGGNIYAGVGHDYGIETGLYDEEAMLAFQDYTQFFTSYNLPVSADFANRFRTGEMPIGVAPYTTYAQLQVSAPEIRGLWSIAPVPGQEQANGEINNTFVSQTTQSIMLDHAKDKEAAWEFLKWWSSEETQLEYAMNLEGIMGPAARYASANVSVLEQLPFPLKDAQSLITQLGNTVGVPEVPGGYMTTRMIDYAFKNVVTDGQNPREALYLNAKDIDDELSKKREEFGLSVSDSDTDQK